MHNTKNDIMFSPGFLVISRLLEPLAFFHFVSRARRFWTAPRQMTDGSPTGQASARARVGNRWPRPVDRSVTEVLPRRVGQPFLFEAGTRDRCRCVRRSMALLKPLASGPGFCRVPDTSGVDVTFFL